MAVVGIGTLSLVLAGTAPAGKIASTSCTGPIGPTTVSGNVAAGPGCTLNGTTVTGDVDVLPGGSLNATNASVHGSVLGQGATQVFINGGSVGVDVQLSGGLPCAIVAPNSVGGSISIQNAAGNADATCGGFSVIGAQPGTVAGGITISNNSVASSVEAVVAANVQPGTVAGGLTVDGNTLTASGPNAIGEIAILGQASNSPAAVGGDLKIDRNTVNGSNDTVNGIVTGDFGVDGSVTMQSNTVSGSTSTDATLIQSMSIGGNLLFQNNSTSGPAGATVGNVVDGSTVTGNFNCGGNTPSPATLGNANTAKNANGQCASMPNLFG